MLFIRSNVKDEINNEEFMRKNFRIKPNNKREASHHSRDSSKDSKSSG